MADDQPPPGTIEEIEEKEVKPAPGGGAKKKKKPKKKKTKKQLEEEARAAFKSPIDPEAALSQIVESLGKMYEDKKNQEHQFWDKQPVLKLVDEVAADENGPIEADKTQDQVRQEPFSLGEKYSWEDVNIDSPEVLDEVYNLLKENYVEDDDNMFRFDYSIDFLRWALKPPGFRRDWHLGIRRLRDGALVGFITGIPASIRIYEKKMRMVEINFLCVHKRLRKFKMAPHLIREITRRVNVTGIFQAVYTAGIVLPKPVASCRYYHRSLDPIKLIAIRFSPPPKANTSNTMIKKKYRLPSDAPLIPGIRPLTPKDVGKACALLSGFLKKFHISASFDEQEFAYWFLPREGVINTFVVEDPKSKQITDMCSFYTLPSTIIGNPKYSTLKAAYSFYNVATSVDLVRLMTDALILAKSLKFDVFNALDIFYNEEFLEPLKFGKGDGHLQYYFYNWKCPPTKPENMALVLM